MARSGIDGFFMLSGRGSAYGREFLAGVTSFMTMAYILIIHPSLLAAAGMDQGASVV